MIELKIIIKFAKKETSSIKIKKLSQLNIIYFYFLKIVFSQLPSTLPYTALLSGKKWLTQRLG